MINFSKFPFPDDLRIDDIEFIGHFDPNLGLPTPVITADGQYWIATETGDLDIPGAGVTAIGYNDRLFYRRTKDIWTYVKTNLDDSLYVKTTGSTMTGGLTIEAGLETEVINLMGNDTMNAEISLKNGVGTNSGVIYADKDDGHFAIGNYNDGGELETIIRLDELGNVKIGMADGDDILEVTPTLGNHAANKGYVDDEIEDLTNSINGQLSGKVSKTGDTMTGPLTLNAEAEAMTVKPTVALGTSFIGFKNSEGTALGYLGQISGTTDNLSLSLNQGSNTGDIEATTAIFDGTITGKVAPTDDLHLTNKAYVDAADLVNSTAIGVNTAALVVNTAAITVNAEGVATNADAIEALTTGTDGNLALKVDKTQKINGLALAGDIDVLAANISDVYSKTEVDAADALKVNKAGDTMTGNLTITGSEEAITLQPTLPDTSSFIRFRNSDGAMLGYIGKASTSDDLALVLNQGGNAGTISATTGNFTGNVSGENAPTDPTHLTNKEFVNLEDTLLRNRIVVLEDSISGDITFIGTFDPAVDFPDVTGITGNSYWISIGEGDLTFDDGVHSVVKNDKAIYKLDDTSWHYVSTDNASAVISVAGKTGEVVLVAADISDVYSKIETDGKVALKVDKAGDTMTGQLKGITPVDDVDLTRKDYVDDQIFGNQNKTNSNVINKTINFNITYMSYVVILCQAPETDQAINTFPHQRFNGKFVSYRGSDGTTGATPVLLDIDINVKVGFNSTIVASSFLNALNSNVDHGIYTCMYQGIRWVVLKISSGSYTYGDGSFVGQYFNAKESDVPTLTVITEYNNNTDEVINQEIHDSLVLVQQSKIRTDKAYVDGNVATNKTLIDDLTATVNALLARIETLEN